MVVPYVTTICVLGFIYGYQRWNKKVYKLDKKIIKEIKNFLEEMEVSMR